MFHLRLIKGLSYSGVVSASRAAPDVFVEDEEKYRAALASGHFKAVQEVPAAAGTPAPAGEETALPFEETDITKLTIEKLRDYAVENGIRLTGCTTKNEMVRKIREYEADAAAAAAITGQGSPTMIELQKE